jgi:hypothetical protein
MMIGKFLFNDDGAVTIDWVSLTAGILLLGIAVVYGVYQGGVLPLTGSINGNLAGAGDNVPTSVAAGPTDDFSAATTTTP